MLPSDLLIQRYSGEELIPKRLPLTAPSLAMATDAIVLFLSLQGKTQGEVDEALRALEGESVDYRVRRGLAHLLFKHFSTFETRSPLEPVELRQRIFTQAAAHIPSPETTEMVLAQVAVELTRETGREVSAEEVRRSLYADLEKNKLLTHFEEPTPEALVHRYNLSQVQGIFYRASDVVIHAYRNDPGEYKLLFRYLKLFQLLATIEGDTETGFTIKVDGPASLFTPTTRYGNKLAMLVPALLHVTRWKLVATLQRKATWAGQTDGIARYSLDSECGLVTHYPKGAQFDSLLEESLASRWNSTKTPWRLEREVELVPVPGSVMIPDFRLVHPDGRSYLLEIVGYWRPEYLRKKAWQVRQSGRDDLVLAISERLNLENAGVDMRDLPARVIWFKDKLTPKQILETIERPAT